jgi:uncharacterized protein YraI
MTTKSRTFMKATISLHASARWTLLATIACLAAAASSGASAQAVTTSAVNVRAGPDRIFPTVTWVLSGTPAKIHGCVNSWRWCDVTVGRDRGWIYARYLSVPRDAGSMTVLQGGPGLGLPSVEFSLRSYWDAHYGDRLWFAQAGHYQTRWERRRPQPEWTDSSARR